MRNGKEADDGPQVASTKGFSTRLPVFMRTKTLRALGQIVTSDSSVLSMVSEHDGGVVLPLDESSDKCPSCHWKPLAGFFACRPGCCR